MAKQKTISELKAEIADNERQLAQLRHKQQLSAFWIPELTVTEVIHGTTYVVTGSYEGTENFVRKLERITSKKFAEKLEDSE